MPVRYGQHGHDEQQDRVADDERLRDLLAVRDRQHRDPGALVVRLARDRERPEVRRRPREDDQEQQQRVVP